MVQRRAKSSGKTPDRGPPREAPADTGALRVHRPDNPFMALGVAVNHLMTKPAFARQPFGTWARILVGQINREHYVFAMEGAKVVGFLGWAFAPKEKADAWLAGEAALSFEDSRDGDVMLINAWQADSMRVTRFLLDECRRIGGQREWVYFKRYYPNGTSRVSKLTVNDFVAGHLGRDAPAE